MDGERGVFVMDSDGTNARMILPVTTLVDLVHAPEDFDDIYWFSDSKNILIGAKFSGFSVVDTDTLVLTALGGCNNREIWARTITIDRNDKYIGFKDFDSHGIIVRPINDPNCSVWLQADEINDGGPLTFTEEPNQLIQLESAMLYRYF